MSEKHTTPASADYQMKLLLHHEVRRAAWEDRPHLPRKAVLNLADGDAELNELFLGLVHACPLVAVLVHAGVEEAVATSAAGLELVREFREHVVNLLTVSFDAARMESDGSHDALCDDVAGSVFAVLEEAVQEDGVDEITSQGVRISGHDSLSPHSGGRPNR